MTISSTTVGRHGASITTLGFGGAPIGNLYEVVPTDVAISAIDAAWMDGIRYFDTAPHYGLGLSERRIGQALASRDRDSYAISTKVGRLLEPNPNPRGSDLEVGGFHVPDDVSRVLDYSREGVRRSVDSSLGRLGTDFIDVVFVHDPDEHVEQVIRETFPALEELRDEGVIRAIGAGMNTWSPLLEFVRRSAVDVVMLAGRWTLLDRSGQPLLEECLRRNVAVVAAAPFNSGILATSRPKLEDHYNYARTSSDVLTHALYLAASCETFGVELPSAALQFPLRHPAVASVVVGIRDASEADENVSWFDEAIPDDLWTILEGGSRRRGDSR